MMRSCRSMISRWLSIELPARQQPAWRADVYFPDHANVGQSFERLHERALKADSDVSGAQDPLAITALPAFYARPVLLTGAGHSAHGATDEAGPVGFFRCLHVVGAEILASP